MDPARLTMGGSGLFNGRRVQLVVPLTLTIMGVLSTMLHPRQAKCDLSLSLFFG